MKSLMLTLTRGALAAALTACGVASVFAADLKVGLSVSLSGPNSSLGVPYAKGMQAALAYKPEINGRKVQLIVLDDGSDPTTAGRNARKLVEEEKVDVLMGTSGVPAAIAMAQVGRDAKTPMIGLTPILLDPNENPWVMTVAQPTQLMIDAVVERMKRNNVKTVGYIGFTDAWGDLVYDALMKAAPGAGIKVVSNERYARADASVTGQVLKIVALRPDAVMTGGAGTPGALPFLALQERGYKGGVYGQHGLINPDFVRVVGAAGQNALMPTGPVIVAEQLPDSYPTKKIATDFRAVFQKVNNAPTSDAFSAYSFDGWLVFADAASRAMKKAEPGTAEFRVALRDAIFSTKEVVGTHGVYSFKPGSLYGVDERARVIVKLDNGQWKLAP
ncbi:branched-chain amino acid transport system substrate-binding protein [Variovorax boronicumulans]|jgi:branched-chain amino acid transport system substrate-binding protein|uniref:ABC transporter substrate-binding protein n=1 Tax=Variovorax TaxID=34072 RepID=UPI002789B0B3|nr:MULTISPECIES: ABC transporter substrate-binding protein [Variovorax]MDP9990826.1 branched-chain amino acid transport system substrate-binding protein [Variovorax boronicumulans]MDQ0002854.1 branched-chain amino acid transport system substrate-binding protein [Variovorax boronicumulans]MDQ0032336.1 branched-chain amino acid transport system substrate-binding protein [Variovorax boronicumulans]MDQ0040246.1 branched-chain amino acid transport system substrate-binding protein [Variovorax boronic